MDVYEYGDVESDLVLVQMVDEHDLALMEREAELIRSNSSSTFRLFAFRVDDWQRDLSPWFTPAVFGDKDFGSGAGKTLEEVLSYIDGKGEKYIIGGYSLAGLFALWVSFTTELFSSVAAASPSIWFPGFLDYMRGHDSHASNVYLSLGKGEEKTKNRVMSTVGRCIREADGILRDKGVRTILEWNEGNHFCESENRTAKAFSAVINSMEGHNEIS